jgi:hypothetical protein
MTILVPSGSTEKIKLMQKLSTKQLPTNIFVFSNCILAVSYNIKMFRKLHFKDNGEDAFVLN